MSSIDESKFTDGLKALGTASVVSATPAMFDTAVNSLDSFRPSSSSLSNITSISKPQPPPELTSKHIISKASYYDLRGRLTANGQIMDPRAYSCAHKTLPFGTELEVTRLDNGKTTRVIVNDRGPFVQGRDIDLSIAAADQLELTDGKGVAPISYVVLGRTKDYAKFNAGQRSKAEIMQDNLAESFSI